MHLSSRLTRFNCACSIKIRDNIAFSVSDWWRMDFLCLSATHNGNLELGRIESYRARLQSTCHLKLIKGVNNMTRAFGGANNMHLLIWAPAEEFGQNYVRSAATSVDKSENSPQFSYIILR